jgi:hypothetical protein
VRAAPWVGWGADPREHPASAWRLRDLPGPPKTRWVRTLSCCCYCSDGLHEAGRCTTSAQFTAIQGASDADLIARRVDGCLLDIDEECDRRYRASRYASPIGEPRRLSERLTAFLHRPTRS